MMMVMMALLLLLPSLQRLVSSPCFAGDRFWICEKGEGPDLDFVWNPRVPGT